MPDNDIPSPGRWPHRRWVRRILVVAGAAALTLGLAAPVAALLPYADEAPYYSPEVWDPAPAPTDPRWQPPPGTEDVASPETTEPAPTTTPDITETAPAPVPAEGGVYTPPTGVDVAGGDPPASGDPAAEPQETTQQKAERQMSEAIDDVRALLADPRCAALIGRWPNDFPETSNSQSALEVFNQIVEAQNPRGLYNSWSQDYGTAFAIGGRLDSEAGRPVIEVYRRFHEVELPAYSYNSYAGEFVYQLTPREARALVLLHELRHIQGTIGDERQLPPDQAGPILAAENEAIIRDCLPGAKREPNPTYIRAPQDPVPLVPVDELDTTLNPPTLTPVPPPPDGESDDPVIFDTDIVIRGEDGSTVEGGSVGDPNLDEPNYDDPFDPFYDNNPNGPGNDDGGYVDPDPGEPYDPGYGGGDDSGGGGGDGGDEGCEYSLALDIPACDGGYYLE